jgi:CRISPR-associated protein Csd2
MNNRYDFVFLFDIKDGNPNGDPDAGNLPRLDAESGHGLVTDVCMKRKLRNFVALTKNYESPNDIYVREKAVLNLQQRRAYAALEKKPDKGKEVAGTRDWMCKNFYDIRTFGAVMSTGEFNCGQVRGPVQIAFARSIDRIFAAEHALTVCAARMEDKPIEAQIGIQGRKFTVPYALYRAHGFINPFLAKQTGFGDADLDLLKSALGQMFELDRSAARGVMSARRVIAFKHATALGNAPAHKLFDLVKVAKKPGVEVPRSYEDYEVTLDTASLPSGVTIEEWV